jgi:RNA polymerase sigma-70 factor (ECF subfamily)
METDTALRVEHMFAFVLGRGAPLDEAEARSRSFEEVYNTHHRDVSRHVLLTTRGRDDTEEIVAETFARAFAAWRTGHGPAGRALPWLLVIARRIATDRWRRRRLIGWLPLPDPGRSTGGTVSGGAAGTDVGRADNAADVAEFWMWLDALSRALPARQRDVIFLRYQSDLTDEDIGEILGLSASGVRTLASRALAALRKHPELWS